MTAKVIANLKTARILLGKIGISRKKIKEVDLTADFTLRDKILQKVGRNRQFPIIFIDEQPIGVCLHFVEKSSHSKLFFEKN
jgi:glutaredoxin